MSKQFKKGIETDFTSSRIVLVEKTNTILNRITTFLIKTQQFSTNIVPLPNGDCLIYQESPKAAYSLLGFEKLEPKTILVRVVIIKKEFLKVEGLTDVSYNVNISLLSRLHSYVSDLIFHNVAYVSYTDLLIIPYSAKDIFIQYCFNCYNANKNYAFRIREVQFTLGFDEKERGFRRELLNILDKKDFPYFMIRESFSEQGIINGNFLDELNSTKHPYGPGRRLRNSKETQISLFKDNISRYTVYKNKLV